MWDEENSAETVTIHPLAGASQPQVWQGMGRSGNNNFPSGVRGNQQQRSWDPLQQQQMPLPGAWAPQNLAWASMAQQPAQQPGNTWHMPQQQWAPSNSPSGTYADKAKNNAGNIGRLGGPPSMVSASGTNVSSRFDQMSSSGTNWAVGSVKVDQQTPWDTTGSGVVSHNLTSDSREWNAGSTTGNGSSGANTTRWGQPASVGLPPGASNAVWPQPVNNLVNNTSGTITGANNAIEWSQNPVTLVVAGPPRHSHKPPHDVTGTAHWSAGAPPPAILMNNGSVVPPASNGPSGNWCQPGIGGAGPPAPDSMNRLPYDPNPQTPGPWVAPQAADMNNDMIWRDPNPKQKKVQRDIGTSIWGDPSGQRCEIRRWKEAEQVTDYSAPPSGTDWASLPLTVSTPLSVNNNFCGPTITNNDSAGASDGLSVNGGAASNTTSWGEPTLQTNSGIDIGTSQWGATAGSNGGNNVNNSGAMWPSQQTDLKPQGDDVFFPENMNNTFQTASSLVSDALGNSGNNGVQNADKDINEQVQNGIRRGLIDPSAIESAILGTDRQKVVDLLKFLKRLIYKEREIFKLEQQLQTANSGGAFKNEDDRLMSEIKNAKAELMELQCNIIGLSGSAPTSTPVNSNCNNIHNGSLPQDGQSRLQQWKKTNNMNNSGSNSLDSASDSNSIQLILAATQNLSLHSVTNNSGSGLDDKSSSDWKSGTLDWSAPSTIGSGNGFDNKSSSSANNANFNGGENLSNDSVNNAEKTPGLVDDGPPEFVPGKKWEWRDPNKVAEDPNATPGTCKPNPLLSSAALQHPLVGSSVNSSVIGSSATTSASDNLKTWSGVFSGVNLSNDMWNKQRMSSSMGGPPLSVNCMMNGPPPPNLLGYNSNNRQFSPAINGYWILFQIVNMSEQQIMQICHRVGRLLSFMVVGQKIACAKFADANVDTILQRIKVEFMIAPQHVKLASDEEFDKMMRSSIASNVQIAHRWPPAAGTDQSSSQQPQQQQQQQQHWANDAMMLAMQPPPHFGNDFPSGAPF